MIFCKSNSWADVVSGLDKPKFRVPPQNEYVYLQKNFEVVNFIKTSIFGCSMSLDQKYTFGDFSNFGPQLETAEWFKKTNFWFATIK